MNKTTKTRTALSRVSNPTFRASETLRTLVATVTHGSRETHTAAVELWYGSLGFGIRIAGTPGSWYLSTLIGDEYSRREFGSIPDTMAIDCGQNWTATGLKAAIKEAMTLILSGEVSKPAGW